MTSNTFFKKLFVYFFHKFLFIFNFSCKKCNILKHIITLFISLTLLACSSGGVPISTNINKIAEKTLNEYIIQPGDILSIDIIEKNTTNRIVPVRPDGKISLPQINDIQAAGLSPLQLKDNLLTEYKNFFNLVEITVTVTSFAGSKISIIGFVNSPGQYILNDKTTFLEALSLAGGITELSDPKKINIIRYIDGKRRKFTINYNKILTGENEDIWILPGDIIIVP